MAYPVRVEMETVQRVSKSVVHLLANDTSINKVGNILSPIKIPWWFEDYLFCLEAV